MAYLSHSAFFKWLTRLLIIWDDFTHISYSDISDCRGCRVLTIHGSGDEIVPTEDAMEFAKHIFNHKLHIIEGADHEYTSHQNELSSVVLNFVQSGSSHDNAQSENKSRRSFL